MFSKACEYGIRATLYIAEQSLNQRRVNIREIAKAIDSPEAFTAKIMQQLVKSQIVHSVKGPLGGFEMLRSGSHDIKLYQIVKAIDGDNIYKGCGLGLKECNEEHPCPVHFKFLNIREELREMLETTSITELAKDLDKGIAFLKQ
ncbi:transcriptional regulator, BadM/Rrf2 family [Zhouia amylolytica]|uniref:Transcriptional regulator, BadM/Rrf2 family n=2 Tax=Zhouia amylolytica TaxID=376730 RepID=W2URQ5_9FLAO|nr:Rrf2 family transcriptional regulator [Zhouia amylolytica]ETN96161.1 transcriptional regulator, BadM/Rrf2 family [Zhouia amylolytica AD3]MCQ0112268.1 Rrf2 family transcriptional regulator [Zhouia amylolytica]SFT14317.1 transcriptional regulator, BadM/Rrf2 family [Zhouia amylolytica]